MVFLVVVMVAAVVVLPVDNVGFVGTDDRGLSGVRVMFGRFVVVPSVTVCVFVVSFLVLPLDLVVGVLLPAVVLVVVVLVDVVGLLGFVHMKYF